MATLTLDTSTKALAVLAWRKGLTKKRFSLQALHAIPAKQVRVIARKKVQLGKRGPVLTRKQAVALKR